MSGNKGKRSSTPRKDGDSEANLQKELSRETAEGADSVGDVGSNRTLTGSSSWETLPGKDQAPAPLKEKGRPSKKAQDSGGETKKHR